MKVYVAVAENGFIVKIIFSPAHILGAFPLLLERIGFAGVLTLISRDVLTLLDRSGSNGVVMLAVIVYGALKSDKSRGDMFEPRTGLK